MYSTVKYYLKTNMPMASLDFQWNDEENENFFAYLNDNLESFDLNKAGTQLEIKQAFKEYFENIGYILFKINDNKIRLRVFPYKIEPKESINLEPLISIIESNEQFIEDEYKGKPDQILIHEKLIIKIYDFANSIDNEEINKKELIRCSVRQALGLQQTDIIIIKKDKIFIKLYDPTKRKQLEAGEENTIANRFNGIDEDELESFYDEYFTSSENKNFFPIVAKLFIEKYFKETQIDNANYEKNVLGYIQGIIIDQLMNNFDHSDEFFKGFSGYIFRKHFKEVFEHIADFILIEISSANHSMIEFLKYYSLNIVIVNGQKYKVPALEADNGLKWNVISMLSIVKIYTKINSSIKTLRKEVSRINEQLSLLYIGDLSPVEYQSKYIKERESLENTIAQNTHELNKTMDALDMTKDDNRKEFFRSEIEKLKRKIEFSKNKKSQLKSAKQTSIKKYTDLKAELDFTEKEINREKKILSQNAPSYISIKNALTKALMSKKERL